MHLLLLVLEIGIHLVSHLLMMLYVKGPHGLIELPFAIEISRQTLVILLVSIQQVTTAALIVLQSLFAVFLGQLVLPIIIV